MLEDLHCEDRLNALLSGKEMGNMEDYDTPMQNINKFVEDCHFVMIVPVCLWYDEESRAFFVNDLKLINGCKNSLSLNKFQVIEWQDARKINADTNLKANIRRIKETSSTRTRPNFQVKNLKVYDHTTNLAFTMTAIRHKGIIAPITQTDIVSSGTSHNFHKLTLQNQQMLIDNLQTAILDPYRRTATPSDKTEHKYVICDILLTGPEDAKWPGYRYPEFSDIVIQNFGQVRLADGLFTKYREPVIPE